MSDTVDVITPKCPMCDKESLVAVEAVGFRTWQAGAYIQVALPMLDAGERELLMTGMHPTCWDKMMEEIDNEEDDDELLDRD